MRLFGRRARLFTEGVLELGGIDAGDVAADVGVGREADVANITVVLRTRKGGQRHSRFGRRSVR